MTNKLEDILVRYEKLNTLVADPEVIKNIDEWRGYTKELASMEEIVDKFKEYKLKLPEKTIQMHQDYVFRELDRGLRRGGKSYPSKEELTFKI